MQKIIEQDLGGGEEYANNNAQYTWEKDEIAWYFCTSFKLIYKIKFTGKHWLSGNKWSRNKIYEYVKLECSADKDSNLYSHKMSGEDLFSWSEENNFYTEREEVIQRALNNIERIKDNALKEYQEKLDHINHYRNTIVDLTDNKRN